MAFETSKLLFMESKAKQFNEEVASHIIHLKCKSPFIEFIFFPPILGLDKGKRPV